MVALLGFRLGMVLGYSGVEGSLAFIPRFQV